MANLKAGTLIGGNMIWHAGNMPLSTSANKVMFNGYMIYTEANKPTAADVGAVSKAGDTMTGILNVNSEIRSKSSNSYRMSDGVIGTFWRKDGDNLYLMRTEKNQAESGTWSAHRPFAMNLETAKVTIGNGLLVNNGLEVGGDMTLNNKYLKGANNSIIIRDHGNGNVTLSASVNSEGNPGDLYLGYNASASGTAGYNTRKVLLRSPMDWAASHNLVNGEGKINSEQLAGPIRTEKGSDGIYHTVVGGTDTTNRGRTIVAAGECGKVIHENTTSGDEVVHIGGDAGEGVWIHTGLQSGWGSSGHKRTKFSGGDIYVEDGTKRVFRQGWDFGLGGRNGTAADAVNYTEDKTRDFNKLITAGEYSVSGEWLNGWTNVATAVSHTGIVKVEVRYWSAGPAYVQTYTSTGNGLTHRRIRYGTGAPSDITWGTWNSFGQYEMEVGHRIVINRTNSTGAPYITLKKRDLRTDLTSGWYNFSGFEMKQGDGTYDPANPGDGSLGAGIWGARLWDNTRNRLVIQLRQALDGSKAASEVVLYEDSIAITQNGNRAARFSETAAEVIGTFSVGNKIYHNAMASSNKQVLNANGSDYVYVGNPTVKNLYLETDSNGNVFANAGGSAKRIYHEGYIPSIDALGLTGKIIGAPKTLAKENLDDIKTAGVYAQNANANTPGLNYPEEKAGTLTVTVAAGPQQKYHVYNTSNVYTRAQYSTGGWTAWQRNITTNDVNMSNSGNWSSVINKIPRVKSDGVMEVGRYIDMHIPDSTKDFDVRMEATANSTKLYNQNGYIELGPINTSYAHIYTDRPEFYFNKGVTFVGHFKAKDGNIVMDGSGRKHIILQDPAGVDGYIWKDPGQYWEFNHGTKADSKFRWTPNGEFIVFGDRWAATHAHAYASQPGILGPIHIDFGTVAGGSDYYPMVRSTSLSSGYGYTTQVDLGVLRSGGAAWGQGVIRVGSHESSSHPAGIFYFDINGNFSAPGNVTAFSDERVKDKIEEIENALDKIDLIRGVTYNRTDIHGNPRHMGVIAQEVEKVAPEAVSKASHDTIDDFKAVSYGSLVGLLIEGIKELREELNELKKEMGK